MKSFKEIKKTFNLKTILIIAGIMVIILAFMLLIYECPTEHFLGIPCPWCGLSRAFFSLFRLDIAQAFYYHPLFPVIILIALYEILKWLEVFKVSSDFNLTIYIIVFVLFIVVFIIRHIAGSPVVAINLKESALIGHFLYIKI